KRAAPNGCGPSRHRRFSASVTRAPVDPGVLGTGFPVLDLTLGLVLGNAVTFLNLARELVALAGDDVEVVVGQLAPLLLDLALHLLPVTFDAVPIHGVAPW